MIIAGDVSFDPFWSLATSSADEDESILIRKYFLWILRYWSLPLLTTMYYFL